MTASCSYSIWRPSGNDTAIVQGLPAAASTRQKIARQILARHQTVEQVGFLSACEPWPRLEMAGGEFCGNAVRAAAAALLARRVGALRLAVSGAQQLVTAGVAAGGVAWADVPTAASTTEKSTDIWRVQLPGITHLIVPIRRPFVAEDVVRARAEQLLQKAGLWAEPAAGVLFARQLSPAVYALQPVVRVAALNTLFAETACGSGTIALALWQRRALTVWQPSGQAIVATAPKNGCVRIAGQTTLLGKYRARLA